MATLSFFNRVLKGLSDGLFKVVIEADPGLAQEINKLYADKNACLAFKKLAQNNCVTLVHVPGEYGNAFLPSGLYEVTQEAEWKTFVHTESVAWAYIDGVNICQTTIVDVAVRALSQDGPENEAARMALARLMDAKFAAALAIANRKQLVQVYDGTASPVMIPVDLLALPLIFRRAFDLNLSEAVKKHQDHLQELLFQEISQEISPGIGFKMTPIFQKLQAQSQITELQKAYSAAAWAFSSRYVDITTWSDNDDSDLRKLWRKAALLLNQIDALENQSAITTSVSAPDQSPSVKQWTKSYIWSLSWGVISLVTAILLQVKPLFDVGDSVILSGLTSTLILVAAVPMVFHVLDLLGYYTIFTIAAVIGSLWLIISTVMGNRSIHDQTTWIWLFIVPLMIIYEIFRDRAAKDIETEDWRKGVI
ncbi:MAG: hypothetical protein ABIN18_13255 [Pseudomonadota bacterium]